MSTEIESELTAIIRNVLENPYDYAAYDVWIDWLMEHGREDLSQKVKQVRNATMIFHANPDETILRVGTLEAQCDQHGRGWVKIDNMNFPMVSGFEETLTITASAIKQPKVTVAFIPMSMTAKPYKDAQDYAMTAGLATAVEELCGAETPVTCCITEEHT